MKRLFMLGLAIIAGLHLWAQTPSTNESAVLELTSNTPNPFNGWTEAGLTVTAPGTVNLTLTDAYAGTVKASCDLLIEPGFHRLRIQASSTGLWLLTAVQSGNISSIKMICSAAGEADRIDYLGLTGPLRTRLAQQPGQPSDSFLATEDTLAYATPGLRKASSTPVQSNEKFRVALSLSPFSLNQFQDGYRFEVNGQTATTPEELQEIYRDLGSTEMYVRIATKRHVTADNLVDGKEDENANVHTFDQGIRLCRIAAALDMPINPEIMCAYTYMDMDRQQAPRFEEYPEVYALQNGKDWSELTIDEICTVLEAYGALVADSILSTGCTVNNWNLGNEANFGFAGISMGLKTAVDPKLEKASTISKYLAPVFATWWLKKHVWEHNAKAYAALKKGILSAYEKNSIDASNVKFSTHIATVVFPARCSASFFKYMAKNGYDMETAGISYYPSAPSMSLNRKKLLTKTVAKINKKCGVPVFIGEFSYPSGKMDGPFAGWNKKLKGYEKEQQGQADIYADVIRWGRHNGLAGIRYWAPDYEGWYAMSMFEFANKKGTAKTILQNHQEFVNQ